MTSREAKRLACYWASLNLENFSAWDCFIDLPEADQDRVQAAMVEITQELFRRGKELDLLKLTRSTP